MDQDDENSSLNSTFPMTNKRNEPNKLNKSFPLSNSEENIQLTCKQQLSIYVNKDLASAKLRRTKNKHHQQQLKHQLATYVKSQHEMENKIEKLHKEIGKFAVRLAALNKQITTKQQQLKDYNKDEPNQNISKQ